MTETGFYNEYRDRMQITVLPTGLTTVVVDEDSFLFGTPRLATAYFEGCNIASIPAQWPEWQRLTILQFLDGYIN
jgi:hypothetical protein